MSAFRFCSLLACLALAACREAALAPSTVERDDFGGPIAFAAPATRIVSLNPTTTELLFALGAGSHIVGRSRWDHYPAAALAVPDLGDALRPNVEAVLAVHPDLVILYAGNDNRDAADRFRAAGVPTLALKIDSIAEFLRASRLLGRLIGDSAIGARTADTVAQTLERVRAATAGLERPTVFWKAWNTPLLAIGGGSFLSQLIDIAGGRNIYADLDAPSPPVTLEDVIARDPDYVMSTPSSADIFRGSAAWRALRAVREDHILLVDTLLTERPGVRLGEAAVSLASLLHPGVVR